MAYYYVYSPFSGFQTAQECYCPEVACNDNAGSCADDYGRCSACGKLPANLFCQHPAGINNLSKPIDITGPTNTPVRLLVSSNIKSVFTIRTGPNDDGDPLCRPDHTPPDGFEWVNEGVKALLYSCPYLESPLIGTVFFGHLKGPRIKNGIYNNPNGLVMGKIGDQLCFCDCYPGFHIHMAASSGNSLIPCVRLCGTMVTTMNWIYRWTAPSITCPI